LGEPRSPLGSGVRE